MGYYTRVFCISDKKPTIKQVLDHINGLGFSFKAETNLTQEECESSDWKFIELTYKQDKLPILVEVNEIADDDGLAKQEIEEFLERIGKPRLLEGTKKKVIKHLRETKYIVANQLPTSNIDEDGFVANENFLYYFVKNFGGLFHADQEGFQDGTKIILKTD